MNEQDARVQRTRQQLRQALIDLAATQSYDSITVRDITERAQVGYKTFYRHYDGKQALLQAVVDDIRSTFEALLLPPSDAAAAWHNTLAALAFVEQHRALIVMVLNSTAAEQLLATALALAEAEGRRTFRSPLVPDALLAHHFAASMIGFLRWWLTLGQAYSREEMARYIQRLLILPLRQLSAGVGEG